MPESSYKTELRREADSVGSLSTDRILQLIRDLSPQTTVRPGY